MNPNDLRDIILDFMRAVETVQASGEELPDEMLAEIADLFRLLVDRYEELNVPAPQAATPDMTQAMPSSNVEGFAYNPESNEMFVRFLGEYPNRNGPVYKYDGVPPVIFDLFQSGMIPARTNGQNRWGRWWRGKVPSIGAALYSLIKTRGYPYQRIS